MSIKGGITIGFVSRTIKETGLSRATVVWIFREGVACKTSCGCHSDVWSTYPREAMSMKIGLVQMPYRTFHSLQPTLQTNQNVELFYVMIFAYLINLKRCVTTPLFESGCQLRCGYPGQSGCATNCQIFVGSTPACITKYRYYIPGTLVPYTVCTKSISQI